MESRRNFIQTPEESHLQYAKLLLNQMETIQIPLDQRIAMAGRFHQQLQQLLCSVTEQNYEDLRQIYSEADWCFIQLLYQLRHQRADVADPKRWSDADRQTAERYWFQSLAPLLKPVILPNASVVLCDAPMACGIAAELRFGETVCLGWVPIPEALPALLSSSDPNGRLLPVWQIIGWKLDALFPGYEIICWERVECLTQATIYTGTASTVIHGVFKSQFLFPRQCPVDGSILCSLGTKSPIQLETACHPWPMLRWHNRKLHFVFITLGRDLLPASWIVSLSDIAAQGTPVLVLADCAPDAATQQLEIAGCCVRYTNSGIAGNYCLFVFHPSGSRRFQTLFATGGWTEHNSYFYETNDPLLGRAVLTQFRHRWIGLPPPCPDPNIISMIQSQIVLGTRGRIDLICRELTDDQFLTVLADAARAGVSIHLLTAGSCRLLPNRSNLEIRWYSTSDPKAGFVLAVGAGKETKWFLFADFDTTGCPVQDSEAVRQFETMFQRLWDDALETPHCPNNSGYEQKKSSGEA